MSWVATAWAKSIQAGSPSNKLVLMVLADYANPDSHEAWPSQHQLAIDCEMSERNIRYCLKALTASCLITLVSKGNQHQPSVYRLAVAHSNAPAKSAPAIFATTDVHRQSTAPAPAKSDNVHRQPIAVEPSLTTVIKPQVKTKRVDDTFVASMVEKYQDKYGSAQAVRDEISDALNHKAVDKRKDVQRYVDTWLRRGIPTLAPRRNGTHTTPPTSAADDILSHPIFGPRARRQLEQA